MRKKSKGGNFSWKRNIKRKRNKQVRQKESLEGRNNPPLKRELLVDRGHAMLVTVPSVLPQCLAHIRYLTNTEMTDSLLNE